ncbi:type IVB secretion system protein IcmH/DotU [Coxiella burnetii]|uniref:type IVB secretion system protein IcmH/DotU n=1 Tax=Coxiella burnetii TaxID=777 RepID=UPI0022308B2E|nr:type IVB secretion system protein IcmH/DotU [Coxiella burnetii]
MTKEIFTNSPLETVRDGKAHSVFDASIAINPLVAACAPLLTIATQLRDQEQSPNLPKLYESLSSEIKLFEEKAHSLGYRSPVILAARYFLCALIDEIILHSPWGENSEWQRLGLLKTFQDESWGGERFFIILERSAEDADLHIDLLELGYLCLSLGYKGKYNEKNYQELEPLVDKLYYLIREERGESSNRLFVSSAEKPVPKNWISRLPSVWATLGVTALVLIGIYLPYHFRLEKVASPIRQTLKNMTPATISKAIS